MGRWSNCPGSVRLCETLPDVASYAAAEGTVAHGLLETFVKGKGALAKGDIVSQDGREILIDEEMWDVCCEAAESIVFMKSQYNILLVEQSVSLPFHEQLYGTADYVFVKPLNIYVLDFKYGKGKYVEVENNDQLLYYALGAYLNLDEKRKKFIKTVTIAVLQPRFICNTVLREHTYSIPELLDWGVYCAERAYATDAPEAPLIPGSWCKDAWCKAAAICPALQKQALMEINQEFVPAIAYDVKILAANLTKLPAVEAWCQSVREFSYAEAAKGIKIPGYKLVAKRAQRKYIDSDKAEAVLTNNGERENVYEPRKLLSPAKMEKALGKAAYTEHVEHLVETKSSGTTLVLNSDKRQEVSNSAEDDFTPIIDK